jgi:pimeloyl-ACP methyl ester carboxylesterase
VFYVDEQRLLPVTDPPARQIHIGCGCFIETLSVGAKTMGFGTAVEGFPEGTIFGAFPDSAAARKDPLRVTQSLEPSVTLDAVDALRSFPKPVLLALGAADKLFPLDHARRLQADFADARVEVMDGASTFVIVDQPDELAAKITAFVSDTTSNAKPAQNGRCAQVSIGGATQNAHAE